MDASLSFLNGSATIINFGLPMANGSREKKLGLCFAMLG